MLRASSAHRWIKCSMSTAQTPDMLPDTKTDAAREGTCAAWVAECVINGDAGSAEDLLDAVHDNGWVVDLDMVRFVQDYIDLVTSRRDVEAECYGTYEEHLHGTADARAWSDDLNVRYITDLKYGYEIVEPFENWQLLCYAVINTFGDVRLESYNGLYQLEIYQPRAMHPKGPHRKWVIGAEELRRYKKTIDAALLEYASGMLRTQPGPHCDHCLHAATCQALTETIYTMWPAVGGRPLHTPNGQQLADELTMLNRMEKLFKARKAAVEAEAEQRIKSQQFVPGWSMVERFGKSAWTVSPEIVQGLTGLDPYAEQKPATPAEMVRRGANKDMIATMTKTPVVGRKLSPIDSDQIADMFKE